jgi:hypothetical protein
LSNALALEKLNLGMQMSELDNRILLEWLTKFEGKRVHYPNVPEAVIEWILKGDFENKQSLVDQLWQAVKSTDITNFSEKVC